MKNKTNCILFTFEYNTNKFIVEDLDQGTIFNMHLNDLSQRTFNNMIALFNIELICIDQLVTYPVYQFIRLIQNSGVDYEFYIHDFYCVCPSLKLIDSSDKYCHAETDVIKCQKCISTLFPGTDIKQWRKTFQSFLGNAQEIVTPSENTRELVLKYYPDLSITVGDHQKVDTVRHTFNPEFALRSEINIAFIGALTKEKGSDIIFELLDQIRREELPINIKVIGITLGKFDYVKHFLSEDNKLEVTGLYNNDEISTLLSKHKISLVIIPALWPETYSWIASEAMWSGYPLITYNLGAPADRVKNLDGGWIAEDMNSKSLLQLLKQLLKSREEILGKAVKLKNAFWDY